MNVLPIISTQEREKTMSEVRVHHPEVRSDFREDSCRQAALELFIEALKAKPDIFSGKGSGLAAAKELVDGAEIIMSYILEGKKA
jgi:hypothetical protein